MRSLMRYWPTMSCIDITEIVSLDYFTHRTRSARLGSLSTQPKGEERQRARKGEGERRMLMPVAVRHSERHVKCPGTGLSANTSMLE